MLISITPDGELFAMHRNFPNEGKFQEAHINDGVLYLNEVATVSENEAARFCWVAKQCDSMRPVCMERSERGSEAQEDDVFNVHEPII